MPHVLAKLRNVPFDMIKEVLENDRAFHATQGMYLENIWQNAEDDAEVVFLFRIDDIEATKTLIHKLHADALAENPGANLPTMTYLQ
jgi:hypothetical protein